MEKGNQSIIKIALVGPESTGKSTLCMQLAAFYKDCFVPEFARTYLLTKNGVYEKKDLDFFAREQFMQENSLLKSAKRFLFCDTNPLSIRVWSVYKYGDCSAYVSKLIDKSDYHLHLLLQPDLPYEEDPLREDPSPKNRKELFELFEQELIDRNLNYAIVNGSGKKRLKKAIEIIKSQFSF